MFAKIKAHKILEIGLKCDLHNAVDALVEGTGSKVVVWIEFPDSLLVL
jgi:hypothetical protein